MSKKISKPFVSSHILFFGLGRRFRASYLLFSVMVLGFVFGANAQDNSIIQETVNDPAIRTLQFTRAGAGQQNTYPIIQLGAHDSVCLGFDIMGGESAKNFQFTIVHCEWDWHRSQMLQSDYIRGLYSDYAQNYTFSQGTYVKYTHYKINFPSGNMRAKISGNYALIIYLDDPDRPTIVKRFYVYEKGINIGGTAQRATDAEFRDTRQEINFTINVSNLTLTDPLNDIKTVIRQNWREDNEITNLKPTYVNNNMLIYDYTEGNVFDAGNEFRIFDIRDLRYKGFGVKSFSFDSIYNVYLYPDEDRSYQAYVTQTDQNGGFSITDPTGADASVTADYAMVHFKINPSSNDDGSSEIYIFGGLTDWKLDQRFKMHYSARFGYECDVLLKQGAYDYEYVKLKDGKIDPSDLEGNHWETENNYTVFVYYHPPSALGDLLIGVLRLNTGMGK